MKLQAPKIRESLQKGLVEVRAALAQVPNIEKHVGAASTDQFKEHEWRGRQAASKAVAALADSALTAYFAVRAAGKDASSMRPDSTAEMISNTAHALTHVGYPGSVATLGHAQSRSQTMARLTPVDRLDVRYRPSAVDLEKIEAGLRQTERALEKLLRKVAS